MSRPARHAAIFGTLVLLIPAARAEDPPAKPPEPPVARSVLPFGVLPGQKVQITVRGQRLDTATEARLSPPIAPVQLLSHEKANPPDGLDAVRFGDSRVVVEFTLPADSARDPLALIITTPNGESDPIPIRLDATAATPEKEPNAGFRQSQSLTLPAVVDGAIGQNQDVDVYRIDAPAGARLQVHLLAARRGSALDPLLTLYDDRGQPLATATTPLAPTPDADVVLTSPVPAGGAAWLVVQDANDKGSPLHTYRLGLMVEPPAPAR